MLLAVMLAMVLAVTVPAMAQVVSTGNFSDQQGVANHGSTGGDIESEGSSSTGGDIEFGSSASNEEASCYERIVEQVASNLGTTPDEAAELLKQATVQELDVLAGELCG